MPNEEYQSHVKRAKFNPSAMYEEKKSSVSWIKDKLQGLKDFYKRRGGNRKDDPRQLSDLKLQYRDSIEPGEFVMFTYDPKFKAKLPYYDMFPLVMIVGPAKGGFYGLNFHYLPLDLRAKFFDAYTAHGKKNRRTPWQRRVLVTYQMLKSISNLKAFKPCFKHYLYQHVRSPYSVIKKNEWRAAIFLPTAKWAKGSEAEVWRQSLDLIR